MDATGEASHSDLCQRVIKSPLREVSNLIHHDNNETKMNSSIHSPKHCTWLMHSSHCLLCTLLATVFDPLCNIFTLGFFCHLLFKVNFIIQTTLLGWPSPFHDSFSPRPCRANKWMHLQPTWHQSWSPFRAAYYLCRTLFTTICILIYLFCFTKF